MIKKQTITNFINMETAIKTYDRNAPVCGSPAWRYVYHAIHSADKWFFNPAKFTEPGFLSDEELDEKPDGCEYTRLELILGQFRHISSHIGMINGQTIERTGKFPIFAGLDGKQTDKLFDE